MGDQAIMAVGDDIGEGMQCTDHPYRNNPGGICAFCLQEKLGKLVSSSNGTSHFLSVSSSSSSPSFRSDYGTMGTATRTAPGGSGGRNRVPFLSAVTTQKKKNNNGGGGVRKVTASSSSSTTTALSSNNVVMLKRSKSVAPRPMGAISDAAITDSPRKKSFWSFFYLSSSSSSASDSGSRDLKQRQQQQKEAADSSKVHTASKEDQEAAVAESPGGSQAASSSSFGRKVARSRSVGCGSRSFSGDFLDRISTGFGDCTLRRVESHRESNNNNKMVPHHHHHDSEEQRIKERVKCGGIFGGFGMISSSSSTYWLSAAAAAAAARDEDFGMTSSRIESKTASDRIIRGGGGRSRSWSWAFASPMRAFRPATSSKSNVITSINAADIANGGNKGKMINGGSGSNGKVGANPPLLPVGG